MPEVAFADRTSARRIRQDPRYQSFLSDEDDARESTVKLKANTPDRALEDIAGEAADSKRHKSEKYGQVPLSGAEKERIDFTRTNVMHARSAKAIARGKGVDDWTAYYDETLSTDELRDVFEAAARDERGQSRVGDDDEAGVVNQQARAHHRVQEGELGHAKGAAFGGDRDAQGFVQERVDEPGGSFGDVFDITYSRTDEGRLRGSGQDFERLEEHHEDRSERAQTLDEKLSAEVTRNPFQWANQPNRYDYPAIDTVQPHELHEDRSPQAQALDERDVAPIATSKQQWALSPDRYDWPGVDDVNPERFHASRSEAAQTLDENQFAPIADSQQQWARRPGRYDWPDVDTPGRSLEAGDPVSLGSGRAMEFTGTFTTGGDLWGRFTVEGEAGEFTHEAPASEIAESLNMTTEDLFETGEQAPEPGFVEPMELPSPERNTEAPEPFTTELANQDISLAPEEAFEGVGSGRATGSASPFGLAGGEEADLAFVAAESRRATEPTEEVPDEGFAGWTDERARDGSLTNFGMDADATQYREARQAVEQATTFGIDDRDDATRGAGNDVDEGEQRGFEAFGGGVQENRDLGSF